MSEYTMTKARWYCVSNMGLATLCADQRDAEKVAAESCLTFPNGQPYQTKLLGDVRAMTAEQQVMRQWIADAVQTMEGMRLLYGGEIGGAVAADLIESGHRLVDGGPDDLLAGVE